MALPQIHGQVKPRWGWGLPAWVGAAVGFTGAPQGAIPTPGRGSYPPGWFERSFCRVHPTAVALPPAWSVSLHAWHHSVAPGSSVPSVPGRGAVSLVFCPFPLSWLLQRAPGQSRPPARPPSVPVCVPVLSLVCPRCYHETKSSLWCVKWPNPDCCKIN